MALFVKLVLWYSLVLCRMVTHAGWLSIGGWHWTDQQCCGIKPFDSSQRVMSLVPLPMVIKEDDGYCFYLPHATVIVYDQITKCITTLPECRTELECADGLQMIVLPSQRLCHGQIEFPLKKQVCYQELPPHRDLQVVVVNDTAFIRCYHGIIVDQEGQARQCNQGLAFPNTGLVKFCGDETCELGNPNGYVDKSVAVVSRIVSNGVTLAMEHFWNGCNVVQSWWSWVWPWN